MTDNFHLLVRFAESSVFVLAGMLCLWLGYRLLSATSEFSKWSEQATSNAQSAIEILRRAIAEAKQTLERISETEKKARRERTDFTLTVERVMRCELDKICPDIRTPTDDAKYRVDPQLKEEFESVDRWKAELSKKLDETYDKIVNMEKSIPETIKQVLDRRLALGWSSSAVLAVIGALLFIFAAFSAFRA